MAEEIQTAVPYWAGFAALPWEIWKHPWAFYFHLRVGLHSGCSVWFSPLSSAILWEFSAVSLSIRMDCSGSASCCSALAADALSHANILIFLTPQSPKSPCRWGLCPPRPSQAQPGDLLHVLWMHHEPATSSVPSLKNLLLSFHLYFFLTCTGIQRWLASKKATSPALSLIELLFSMIEDYSEFSSFKCANLC